MGSGTYSSIWIKSPYEQILRVDGIKQIPNTDFDLLHLATSGTISRGVTPLGIPLFQPSLGANDTCYAVGYSNDGHSNKTEIAYLRPDLKQQCGINNMCFTVTQKPQSCSVSNEIFEKSVKKCWGLLIFGTRFSTKHFKNLGLNLITIIENL